MATGETGFADVFYDLVSVQYHSLKAGHDYGQYVRDAENAGLDDIASFFREVMDQDSQRAKRCNVFLKKLDSTQHGVNALSRIAGLPVRSPSDPMAPCRVPSRACEGRGQGARFQALMPCSVLSSCLRNS